MTSASPAQAQYQAKALLCACWAHRAKCRASGRKGASCKRGRCDASAWHQRMHNAKRLHATLYHSHAAARLQPAFMTHRHAALDAARAPPALHVKGMDGAHGAPRRTCRARMRRCRWRTRRARSRARARQTRCPGWAPRTAARRCTTRGPARMPALSACRAPHARVAQACREACAPKQAHQQRAPGGPRMLMSPQLVTESVAARHRQSSERVAAFALEHSTATTLHASHSPLPLVLGVTGALVSCGARRAW